MRLLLFAGTVHSMILSSHPYIIRSLPLEPFTVTYNTIIDIVFDLEM